MVMRVLFINFEINMLILKLFFRFDFKVLNMELSAVRRLIVI